jgi:hypothetical protein
MLLNFPRGRMGLGLLILRCTVAVVILITESLQLTTGQQTTLSLVLMGLAILIGLGLFTVGSSAIASALIAVFMFASHSELTSNSTVAILCAAVTLMGGGAYSIDEVLHGRRRITLPKP